jgi:hypothetical protein
VPIVGALLFVGLAGAQETPNVLILAFNGGHETNVFRVGGTVKIDYLATGSDQAKAAFRAGGRICVVVASSEDSCWAASESPHKLLVTSNMVIGGQVTLYSALGNLKLAQRMLIVVPKTPPKLPPSACLRHPDTCPTIFGPSRKSRKDPEYSRIATRIVGGTRAVFCWNQGDWENLLKSGPQNVTVFGYVEEYRSPRRVNLSPGVCSVLDRMRYRHQIKPPVTPIVAWSLVTFVHELWHTVGVSSEATAECYGIQSVPLATRLLGGGSEYGERVARYYYDTFYNRAYKPAVYLSSECRDGGKLDLNPNSHVWP